MFRILVPLIFLSCLQIAAHAQFSISGPTCVIANTAYQCDIHGLQPYDTVMHICIEGGSFTGSDSSCYNGASLSFIRIQWNMNAAVAKILVEAGSGTVSYLANLTEVLNGGNIDSIDVIQTLENDSIPFTIHCSAASGGSCFPSYTYQWQRSTDGMQWIDIVGATEPDFNLSGISETEYYRRRVTEIASNTIEYSDIATVMMVE